MVVLIALIVLTIGILLLILSRFMQLRSVVSVGKAIYSDSSNMPGEVLYAKSIPLIGKPDFIMKHGTSLIPVEIKRGKTPRSHILIILRSCMHIVF